MGIEHDQYEICRNCSQRTAYTIRRGEKCWQYCEACGIESYMVGKDFIFVGSAQDVKALKLAAEREADQAIKEEQRDRFLAVSFDG